MDGFIVKQTLHFERTKGASYDEFEQGEVAQYFRENAAYVTGLVVSRLKDIKADKPTHPFRPFDAETLVRPSIRP